MLYFFQKFKDVASRRLNLPYLYSRLSYSQEGEDLILLKMFDYKKKGFYVDIGAHHPFRYSNTLLLYQKGWKGINIEPNPNVYKFFEKHRKRDINIQAGVSLKTEKLKYYIFHDPALNTFSRITASIVEKSGQNKMSKSITVNTDPLSKLLTKYANYTKGIDLFNIDCEGYEMQVLRSNNWHKFRPKIIAIEIISGYSLKNIESSNVYKYLNNINYKLSSFTGNTSFFRRLSDDTKDY